MWISSSSSTAGSTSRYGVSRGLKRRGNRRRGVVARVAAGVVRAACTVTMMTFRLRRSGRSSLPGRGHLVLGLLQRVLHVGVRDLLARRCLGDQRVDRVADV